MINYLGPGPMSHKDSQFIRLIIIGLEDYRINRPGCILMDPKLFGPFMICYGLNRFDFESLNSSSSQQAFMDFSLLERIDGPDDPMLEPYDKVTSFSNTVIKHYGQVVLQPLWLWQCQKLALS
jgi:hypothetical protein